ncbi:MAG: chemotaxis protein CheW [Aquabacterium sp.]|jgi:twitching motility protein PilI|uniref:chemotaxis protein CheW n=1 Tax=Aquabacterium sp. TaxID=1872578 RepID=UPI003BB0A088
MANKEALRELQQRLAERLRLARESAPTRSWLAVEAGCHGFLLPLEQAGEIFSLVGLQAVPHSQPWFLGVANLRGQLHGVIDLAAFIGLPARPASPLDLASKDAGRLVAFNASLQLNSALLIDRLLGLRRPQDMSEAPATTAGRPHFITAELADAQGRPWYELNLAALASDEAFLKVAA